MAKIDLKNATIRLWDGTAGTLTVDCTNALSDVTFTLTKHIGSRTVSITYVDPAAEAPLSVVVTGSAIVVNLANSVAPAVTSTAALIAAAVNASADAAALVTAVEEGDGSGIAEAKVLANITGTANSITIKIGEGTLTYSEKKTREFVLDKGNLDTVRDADQEPMDVSFDFVWEFITAESGGTVTVEEALKKVGEAAAWLTTATDTCQPYCIGLEIVNAPACSTVADEYTMFEEFYYESLDHDAKEGSVACSGRSNRAVANQYRVS